MCFASRRVSMRARRQANGMVLLLATHLAAANMSGGGGGGSSSIDPPPGKCPQRQLGVPLPTAHNKRRHRHVVSGGGGGGGTGGGHHHHHPHRDAPAMVACAGCQNEWAASFPSTPSSEQLGAKKCGGASGAGGGAGGAGGGGGAGKTQHAADTCSVSSSDSSSHSPLCRICFQGQEQGELLSPCRCNGSVRCTHQPCLVKWISERGSWSCELCYYKYQVIPISTKNPLQWQAISLTMIEKVQIAAVILGCLFLVASILWLVWSAFSTSARWQRQDMLFQICYGMYGFMDLVCIGLIIHEGPAIYRIFKRWRAVNQRWKVLNYDKIRDKSDTAGSTTTTTVTAATTISSTATATATATTTPALAAVATAVATRATSTTAAVANGAQGSAPSAPSFLRRRIRVLGAFSGPFGFHHHHHHGAPQHYGHHQRRGHHHHHHLHHHHLLHHHHHLLHHHHHRSGPRLGLGLGPGMSAGHGRCAHPLLQMLQRLRQCNRGGGGNRGARARRELVMRVTTV
ncbi:uncharacterized protein LOC144951349 isoform X1 [Lampetra fluviatilis]